MANAAMESGQVVSDVRLTTTSYVVLGLIEAIGPATPYDLKRFSATTVNNFWSVPHTQLYAECERLAGAGLLVERREHTGRRRRVYEILPAGQEAMGVWRGDTSAQFNELRDIGVLKLFFGADPVQLAVTQKAAHRTRLEDFERIAREHPDLPDGMRRALEAGITYERQFIRMWQRLEHE